ncbi:MAG: hypothetical protein QOF41_428 [Methylobacteriaceae bacterium]|nr:hypothetical protein [Methylobacteriaceae bacterium]
MSAEVIQCVCGRANRIDRAVEGAVQFKCGKCGRALLLIGDAQSGTPRTVLGAPVFAKSKSTTGWKRIAFSIAILSGAMISLPLLVPNLLSSDAWRAVGQAEVKRNNQQEQYIGKRRRPITPISSPYVPPELLVPPVQYVPVLDSPGIVVAEAKPKKCRLGRCRTPENEHAKQTDDTPPIVDNQLAAHPVSSKPGNLPRTGTMTKGRGKKLMAPFGVDTVAGPSYLLKLVSAANARDQTIIFVRGGESYKTKIPLGSYFLKAAIGHTWYGREHLFGPDTQFVRMQAKGSNRPHIYTFRREGNKLMGMTVSFRKVVDGNLTEERIQKEEF